jgi:predicted DNA-binding transcriptional regulator AlpA
VPKHQPLIAEELRVLTLREWAALCGFSFMTGKRLIARGDGPTTIQLSPRRVGVRVIDHRKWQEARLRT